VSFAVVDILCFEVILSLGTVVTAIDEYFYDGTTETNNNHTGTQISSQASHIESPNNTITFQGVRRPENQPPDGLFVRDRRLLR